MAGWKSLCKASLFVFTFNRKQARETSCKNYISPLYQEMKERFKNCLEKELVSEIQTL